MVLTENVSAHGRTTRVQTMPMEYEGETISTNERQLGLKRNQERCQKAERKGEEWIC